MTLLLAALFIVAFQLPWIWWPVALIAWVFSLGMENARRDRDLALQTRNSHDMALRARHDDAHLEQLVPGSMELKAAPNLQPQILSTLNTIASRLGPDAVREVDLPAEDAAPGAAA